MRNNPLLDFNFLYELDCNKNRIIFARITALTTNNYPIEKIEGVVTAGSITLDGGSAVRRVCNLTLTTGNLNINNIYWSLTTRVQIEIGLQNNITTYNNNNKNELIDYTKIYPDIIWFPQGIYILTDFKTQAQVNNYTITLSGKDKMCLLNGDIGGLFNAETRLDVERIETENGEWIDEKRSISYIIKEMIHYYAQESFHNIIVRDIDTLSLKVLCNYADTFYFIENVSTGELKDIYCVNNTNLSFINQYYYYDDPLIKVNFNNLRDNFHFFVSMDEDDNSLITNIPTYLIDKDNQKYQIRKIEKGEDLGYQLTETYYPDELIAGVGDTVVSILDKIIKIFGEYEYFYNLEGQFVFQAKKTYVNTAWNNMIKRYEEDDEQWIIPYSVASQVKYAFEGNKIVSAYQNSPSLGNIKNDFTVWGKKKLNSGIEIPIHMRYAIDIKPYFYASYPKTEEIILSNGKKITIGPYQDVFITQEYYKNIQEQITKYNSTNPIINTIKKKSPPAYIYEAMKDTGEDPNACWWTVVDWAEYYKELTGIYPKGSMQHFGKTCFTANSITMPNGQIIDLSHILIMDISADTGEIFNFSGKQLNLNGHIYPSWNGLQHKLNSCTHSFDIFIALHNQYNVDSWIYKPIIPNEGNILYNLPNENGFRFNIVDWREIIYQMAKEYYLYNHDDDYEIKLNRNNTIPEFNIKLFEHGRTGYEQYYHDIEGFWRLLYAPQDYVDTYDANNAKIPQFTINKDDFYEIIENEAGIEERGNFIGPWNKNILENPSNLVFWFDFFDAESLGLGELSVPAIGDRPKNVINNNIRALVYKDIPDIIFINQDEYDNYKTNGQLLDGYNYYILNNMLNKFIENNQIRISSRSITAQETIDNLLYTHAYCNETINITAVPVYYLEPNIIISARDEQRMVHGYYIINKITLPLDYKNTMQITAIKVPERVY